MNNTSSPWIMDKSHDLDELKKCGQTIVCPRHTVLYEQNTEADCVYIVQSGRARQVYLTEDGVEKVLFFLLKGGLFGEAECLEHALHFCRAETITNCELIRIPRAAFLRCLEEHPEVDRNVMHLIAHKLNTISLELLSTSTESARVRVAKTLVRMADLFSYEYEGVTYVELKPTQQEIANLIHATRLTVGEILRDFNAMGIVKKKNAHYVIYDLQRLRAIADGKE